VAVVKSGKRRRKLRAGEKAEIINDDIIELIPGNYFYKYVLITPNSNLQKRGCFEGRENSIGESKRKKIREGISSSSKVFDLFIVCVI
jgi:tyrosyl-DNA phosphodiesterase-1